MRTSQISIHALRGEGDPFAIFCSLKQVISIHALRGEGDVGLWDFVTSLSFQSTPSVGRATYKFISQSIRHSISIHALRGEGDVYVTDCLQMISISIHALRGEGDTVALQNPLQDFHFNPRPPWGGRQSTLTPHTAREAFQSTPSVGRATRYNAPYPINAHISIHALRGEGDGFCIFLIGRKLSDFNPRPPWGGRLRLKVKFRKRT